MLIQTIKNQWQAIRTAVSAVDWPSTGGGTIDPPDDVTERTVANMVNTAEAALTPIRCDHNSGINFLELRAHFNDNAGTATMQIFAARDSELTVKMIAEVDWVAGTQPNADSTVRYFAKTATITQYWPTTIRKNSANESGTGIETIEFDHRGYNRFWIGFDAISGSDNITVEFSGY